MTFRAIGSRTGHKGKGFGSRWEFGGGDYVDAQRKQGQSSFGQFLPYMLKCPACGEEAQRKHFVTTTKGRRICADCGDKLRRKPK